MIVIQFEQIINSKDMLSLANRHVQAVFLITIAFLISNVSATNVLLTLGTSTINQYSTYEFQFIDSAAWSKTGTVQITFQSPPYLFTNNTNITSCKETVTSNTYGLGCYASSSSSISFQWTSTLVTNVGGAAGDSLTMTFTLLNPSYVDTFSIDYSYTLTAGTLYSSTSTTVKGLTADTLTACAIAFSPSYTNSLSSINIQITPKNAIPSGGSLFLSVSGYTVGNTLTSLSTGSNSTSLSSSASIVNSGQTYLISNFFSTVISSGTYLSFSASSILTPPTTAASTYTISVSTLYTASYLNSIDTKSCSLTVSDYPITVAVTFSATFYVGDALRPNITYTTPVSLTFPADSYTFTVDSTSTNYLSVYTANSAGSGGYIAGASSSLFMSNVTTGVSFPSQNMTDTFNESSSIVISGGMFIKSLINSGNKTVFLQVFRNRNSYASGKATITVKPNFLTSASILPANTTVSTFTTYSFTVVTKNVLFTGGGLRITLPSDLFISTGTCTAVASSTYSAINSTVSCTASSSTVIFVTNVFTGSFPAGTSLTVNVSNILNPISIKPTSTYLFQTFYSSSELVNPVDDSSSLTGLTTTATIGRITSGNFAITRNNTANMQYSLYTITYTVTTKFKSGGSIAISFPSFVTLSSSNTCSFTVKDSSTNVTTASQTITPSSSINGSLNIITFSFASSITTTLNADSIFTIVINSLRNYYSFKPITPQLTTYSSDTYMIEQSTSGDVTLTNNIQDTTLSVSSTTATPRINGNPTNCTFSITSPSNMVAGDIISATIEATSTLNTQMYFSTSPTCVAAGTASSCSLQSSNSSLLNITLGAPLTASVASTFSIANIILSRSFDQPGPISFRTFQVSGSKLYNISSKTINPPINTATNVVKTVSLSIDTNGGTVTSQLNQLQKFTLTMTTTNAFQPGDIVVITVPSQYTYVAASTVTVTNTSDLTTLTGSLCSDSTLFCSNNNSNGYLIRVVEKVSGNVFNNLSSLSVTINNGSYQSPLQWTNYNSEKFIVNTYSSTGQPIDAVQSGTTTNATFYLTCSNTANFCGTCYTNGTCKSCYALGTGYNTNFTYGGYYFITSTGVCVTSCDGNFYNSSNSCVQCTAPCYGCTSPGTVCTSCINSTINGTGPFYYFNGTCATTCPNGYFQDSGNVCSACSSPCVTCTGTSVYCTSCNSNKYLSTRLATCGDSVICNATYEFADATTSTLKCSNCSASCNGCSTTSTSCAACATGYIIDTAYGTTLPGRCTNSCPTGTVNDTANALGGGCRCNYTACATCETTINTCLSCNGSKYLQNSACVSSCSSGYYLSNLTCQACASNCTTCNSTTCTVCTSTLYLYQNACISSCPTFTTSTVSGGGNICYSCGSGCTTCLDTSNCLTCATGLYTQINSTNRVCVNTCGSGYYTYNTECRTSCPSGTVISGTNCVTTTDNTTAITTTLTTSSTTRFIPFPYTIGLAVLTIATFISKLGLSHTILPAGLCAFGGIMEVLAWITLMIVQGADSSTSKSGLYVVLIALLLNIMLNIFNFYFLRKYIWNDQKFQTQFKKLRDKTKSGACVTYTCIILSLIFSHKFIEILFSNLYESAYFVYKVTDKLKLSPFNYVRYISLFPSLLAIVGGGISNYQLQTSTLSSAVFIQSIDLIIVTVFSALFGFLVTMRKSEEYETNLAEKRNDIEEELDHDAPGEGIYQLQQEEKQGNRQSKYQHKSSIMYDDPRNDPIGKKRNTNRVNPIGEELNFTNAPLGQRQDDENRLNLHDLTGGSSGIVKKARDSEIDIDHINLVDQGGLDTMPPSKINGKGGKKGGKNGTGTQSQRYNKNANSEGPQKEKIKENIENKLTSEEIQKTKIVRDVDKIDTTPLNTENSKKQEEGSQTLIKEQTKNQQKKEKLEVLAAASPDNLSKISEKDRAKAGEMKNAMKILNAKKVQIGEYLQYLDIIQQEDEDKNSDEYDNNNFGKKSNQKPKKSGQFGKGSNKKVQKKDRTARKNKADDLIVNIEGHNMYDDDIEPQIPDFHQTPIKGRKLSENNFNPNEDQFNNNYSSIKKNQNRSDQQFSKKNGLNDLVLVSLESGENYEKSLGEEFQRGNTLKPVDKDEPPPSNLYATEKFSLDNRQSGGSIPLSRDRIIPNTLINDETQIDYLQSDGGEQETIKGELLDFNNDISPAYFNQPNMRIENDDLSQAPTKPKITKKIDVQKIGKVQDFEDQQQIQGYDEFNHEYDGELPQAKLQRYQSNQGMLDYDDIIYQRKKEKRVKELEKIYLPRQNVNRPDARKNRKNFSSQSYRKEQS